MPLLHSTSTDPIWTTKNKLHKLWQDIDTHVSSHLLAHPDELQSEWNQTWYRMYNGAQLADSRTSYKATAYAITYDSTATVSQCVQQLLQTIPLLSNHLIILQTGDPKKGGMIKIKMFEYGTAPTIHVPTTNIPTSNSFAPLAENDSDSSTTDDKLKIKSGNVSDNNDDDIDLAKNKSDFLPPHTTSTIIDFDSVDNKKETVDENDNLIGDYPSKDFEQKFDKIKQEILNMSGKRNKIDSPSSKSEESSRLKSISDDSMRMTNINKDNVSFKNPDDASTSSSDINDLPSNKKIKKLNRLLNDHDWDSILSGPSKLAQSFTTYRTKFKNNCKDIAKQSTDQVKRENAEKLDDFLFDLDIASTKQMSIQQEAMANNILQIKKDTAAIIATMKAQFESELQEIKDRLIKEHIVAIQDLKTKLQPPLPSYASATTSKTPTIDNSTSRATHQRHISSFS